MGMINAKQEELLGRIRAHDPNVRVEFDDVRNVVNSLRGKLQPAPAKEGKRATRPSVQERLRSILREYGALFGPPDLSTKMLVPLQESTDELAGPIWFCSM